jgi:tape measure domain-containing protein
VAYQADILINVKGFQDLTRIQKALEGTARKIDEVNTSAARLGAPVRNIERFSRQLDLAGRALQKVAIGSPQEQRAISNYVTALNNANVAKTRQNKLIQEEITGRNAATIAIRANVERNIAESKITRAVRQETAQLNAELVKRTRLERQLASRGLMQLSTGRVVKGTDAGVGIQGPALPPGGVRGRGARGGGGGGGRLGGAISGSIIGGAFPLLFGQGAGAAAGGAVGGLVGGLAGPGGSFAGSLLGTLLGDLASKGQAVKDLAEDMGLAAAGTKQLAAAFRAAGQDADKFAAAVQTIRGIGFADGEELEAIKLVSKLTEDYGGKIDKVTAAYGNFVAKGKVGIADINKFTAQGIPILDELEKSYGKNRSQILDMAKAGDITAQALSDALVRIANRSDEVTKRTTSSWEQVWNDLKKGASTSANAFAVIIGGLVGVSANVTGNIATFFSQLYVNMVNGAVNAAARVADALASTANNIAAFYKANPLAFGPARDLAVSGLEQFKTGARGTAQQLRALTQGAPKVGRVGAIQVPGQVSDAPGREKKGPTPPEDRTQQLIEEFNAIKAIGQAEDQIRDLLFDGRELLAAEVELAKQLADIERDRNKALLGANYESEKAVINKIAEARIVDAQLQTEDKIRAIKQQRFEKELDIQEAVRSSVQVFTDLRQQQDAELQYAKTYSRLVMEGLLPAEAARLANFEQLVNEQLKAVETQLAITQAAILEAQARGMSVTKLQEELDLLIKKKQAIEGAATAGPGEGPTDAQRLQDALAGARGELNDLTDPINQVVAGARAIGDAFQQAFMGLVSGAMTGQQALAAFFQGVGDHFMDMASKMIAKLIEIYILETVLGFISGSIGGALSGGLSSGFSAGASSALPTDAGGWATSFATPLKFAEGGFVTGPTRAMVGEGGEPEYIIPASKMSAAMKRYGSGARGSAVIPSSGDTSDVSGNATPVNGAIDVRYTVERINSVDYVTADQFQQGMRQAAQQGAQQGEQRTLRRLQNAPSTRRRVGI